MMDRALAEAWRWDEPELDEIILSGIQGESSACQRRGLRMQVGMRERANGTIVTGPWLDRPAPRRPSPVATKAKGAQPQQPVLALAGPPTVTLTHLKPDATGTLAPRASAARPERARDRSKTTTCTDFQDSRLGSRLVTGRTSRTDAPEVRTMPRLAVPPPSTGVELCTLRLQPVWLRYAYATGMRFPPTTPQGDEQSTWEH